MPTTNKSAVEQPYKVHHPEMLTPLIDPVISTLINKFPNKLTDLVDQQGSPLNLVWPHAFELNTQALLNVLKQYQVPHAISTGPRPTSRKACSALQRIRGSASMCRAFTS